MRLKDNPVRSEAYRRLVAAMPCINCKIEGYSQAAHAPILGKSIKADDRKTFPLCGPRTGITGCHVDFDQYRLGNKAQRNVSAYIWALETQAVIWGGGMWPKGFPEPLLGW